MSGPWVGGEKADRRFTAQNGAFGPAIKQAADDIPVSLAAAEQSRQCRPINNY